MTMPITAYRSYNPADVVNNRRVLLGVDGEREIELTRGTKRERKTTTERNIEMGREEFVGSQTFVWAWSFVCVGLESPRPRLTQVHDKS